MIRRFRAREILLYGAVVLLVGCASDAEPGQTSLRILEGSEGLLEFRGTIHPNQFSKVRGEPYGHHAIVWGKGGAAKRALIVTDVPDEEIAKTLEALGVPAGNNLAPEAWEERKAPDNPAADERVEGASLVIEVRWDGAPEWKPLEHLVGLEQADYRFGDHRRWIPVWNSGCVVCNVSCPGGKISNHTLTIRDQSAGKLREAVRPPQLPPDGTRVAIRVRLREREAGE